MADSPAGSDPFEDLPPELRAMLEQITSAMPAEGSGQPSAPFPAGLGSLFEAMQTPTTGPVDWRLAQKVAAEVATEGDRGPTDDERRRISDAFALAELWLDNGELPSPAEGGRLEVRSRHQWAASALVALRPLVEPVAQASVAALSALASQQFEGMDEHERTAQIDHLTELGIEVPPQVAELLARLANGDVGDLLRPASAALAGLQAGQVVGRLAQQMFGQYDLGIPTAPVGHANLLAINVADVFDGYGLDNTEVAIVLALNEAAHRRLYHALGWLEPHVHRLVEEFAAGVEVDTERLEGLAREVLADVDPEDADQLRHAMERAAHFRLQPTDAQSRVLARLQAVICLVGAWARYETTKVASGRLPSIERIHEVLRRRRATRGNGEELLSGLLGLDLKPADERIGDRFVTEVISTLGADGLRQALAHPENLPDAEELADPSKWLVRTSVASEIPEDLSSLFSLDSDPEVEASAADRLQLDHDDDGGPADSSGERDDD
ncbi:MAG: zinc-dependent metalloprotease [Nitriliruptoraceae bacterium]